MAPVVRTLAGVILRIVLGRFDAGEDADAVMELRDRLTSSARAVDGLESLILGVRGADVQADAPTTASADEAAATRPIQAAIVTVWRDVEAMVRATSIDEEARFIGTRLELDFRVERTDHFEVVGRTFAALPPETAALVRILTVTAGPSDEAALVDTLRAQQPRLAEYGLVASHLGRRITTNGTVEAVHVSVWPDRAAILAATGGSAEVPFFAAELHPWHERLSLEMFDGIEIAPRLPAPMGVPLVILDDRSRIVDLTTAAAAMLGMSQGDLIGTMVQSLTGISPGAEGPALDWGELGRQGWLTSDIAWSLPGVGEILVRVVARRDAPVVGRHAVLVRRHSDPAPTRADLDAAVAEAFPKP